MLKYLVSDYEPRIFIVYKDQEFWATSTTEDYSYVVLPQNDKQLNFYYVTNGDQAMPRGRGEDHFLESL